MQDVIEVRARKERGKRHAKRLRRSGLLPGIAYGQAKEPTSVSVPREALRSVMRHGGKLVQLAGAESGSALIRELQWDAFGAEVLHVDFLRVSADQRIQVSVSVELRGDSPGVKQGGVVEQLIREVEIEVRASAIPDKLHVNINALELHGSLAAKDIEDLPEGAKLLIDPLTHVVHCTTPVEVEEEVPVGEAAEPELIGARTEEESEGEDES
jgi:large subunit ribosomal protein L25